MKKKALFLKTENGHDIAIYPDKVTHLEDCSRRAPSAMYPATLTYVNFVGGGHVMVAGSVEDVAQEIRMHG